VAITRAFVRSGHAVCRCHPCERGVCKGEARIFVPVRLSLRYDPAMDIDTGRMQERISLELLQLNAATAGSGLSAGTAGLDPASVAAISRMNALRERQLTRGRKLGAALARIEAGTYGLCCQCEAELDARWLDADPAAVFCASCTAEREAR
jgi:DnaK suppressor protein